MATAGTRHYFTVLDEAGHAAPAVEYWATMMDDEKAASPAPPVLRIVKLIGSGERLEEEQEGVFVSSVARRTFFRIAQI